MLISVLPLQLTVHLLQVLEDPELATRRGHTSWAALFASSCTQCSLGSSRCFRTAGFLLTCLASLLRAMVCPRQA